MGRRLKRKQMKQDEFISMVDRIIHWIGGNWRQLAVGVGVAAAVGLLYWGATAFLTRRTEAASQAMETALETFSAPVGSAAPADAKVRFATDAERLSAAEKAFSDIKSRYSLTPQAKVAELCLAHIAADRGDEAGAIRTLGELTSKRSSDPIVRAAMLDLVRLRIAKGEGLQLTKELEDMASGSDPRLPRDVAVYELAQVWDHEGKPEEAAKMYRNLVENFPDSMYRYEAQQHLSSSS